MKERGKGFIAGVLVSAALVGTIGTAAATIGTRNAELSYRDIKITLNGRQITPKDSTGTVVEPFTINGTTYLPVRAVADAMGLGVNWNDSTSTVALTAENSSASKLMAFYKCLSESFDILATNFDGIISGVAQITINQTLSSGPYAGMTFGEAAQFQFSDAASNVDALYYECFELLNDNDHILVQKYRELNKLITSYYRFMADGNNAGISIAMDQSPQAYLDASACRAGADAGFWATYNSIQ